MSTKKASTPRYALTAKHRELFRGALKYWQQVLGLMDWRIELVARHAPFGYMSDVECDFEQRLAKVRLPKEWKDEPTDRNLSDTALHECEHILLFPFKQFCRAPDASEEDILSEEHRIINTIERLLSNMSPLGPR